MNSAFRFPIFVVVTAAVLLIFIYCIPKELENHQVEKILHFPVPQKESAKTTTHKPADLKRGNWKAEEAKIMLEVMRLSAVQSRVITHNGKPYIKGTNIVEGTTEGDWKIEPQDTNLPPCSLLPKELKGPFSVDKTVYSWEEIEKKLTWLENGGHGKPADCLAQYRVAIIVPFRNREDHLKTLINNLHSFLKPQQLDYAIIVVEQTSTGLFNRAKLMNVGYVESMKIYPFECFVFHDVDLLPEDDRNLYTCPTGPRHMSVAMDIYNYTLLHEEYFGGVNAMTSKQMVDMNGYPNDYWGWGGEDDDLLVRAKATRHNYTRYPTSIARYTMHKHKHAGDPGNGENACRWKLLGDAPNRWKSNGLNNLRYKIEETMFKPLYIHLVADLMEEESKKEILERIKC